MSHGLPSPRRYIASVAVSTGSALIMINGMIATVALPTIAKDLEVESSAAILVVTIYQLILVMTLLPFATLGDRIGHRRLYQMGLVIFSAASVLCFFANSLPFLLVVRAIQALGAGASLSVSSALIRSIYPPNELGRGMSFNTVIVSSAVAIAPTAGGFVLSFASWPWVFVAGLPLGLFSLALGRTLPVPKPREERFDWFGAILCAATFGLVISGLESAVHGDSPVISAVIVATGATIAYFFIRNELRQARPMLPVDLLAQPVLALSTIGAYAAFVASMSVLLWIPFRLQASYGFSPGQVGAILTPWPMATLILAPVTGMLSDRLPAGLLGGIGIVIAVVALLCLGFPPAHPTQFDMAWRMALCGAGFGMFQIPNSRLILGSAPLERAAAAGGLIATTRLVGQASGATLLAGLLAMGLGFGPVPALVAMGFAMIAGVCSVARLRPSLRTPDNAELEDVRPLV